MLTPASMVDKVSISGVEQMDSEGATYFAPLLPYRYPPSQGWWKAPQSMLSKEHLKAFVDNKNISSLQELYFTRTGRYGDYFNLYDGKMNVYIERGLTKSDPDHPNPVCFDDHYFDISVNADGTDWCAIAIPAEWGRGGIFNIKIDREGIIRYNDVEGDLTNFPKVLGRD